MPRTRRVAALLALALLPLAAAAPPAGSADYCIDGAAGNDAASGLCPAAPWKSFTPTLCFPFQAGDRVLVAAGQYDYPQTGWYMLPGVSFLGAGADRTTVAYKFTLPTPVPFVRFRTGSAGSGPLCDPRPASFGPDTVLADLRLLDQGNAAAGIDLVTTDGPCAPTLARLRIEGFAVGISLHPSDDEKLVASTAATISEDVIAGATDAGIAALADVFYSKAVTEASTVTNVAVASSGAGARVSTLVQDLMDRGDAVARPVLTNDTLAGSAASALLLVSYYNDGTGSKPTMLDAGVVAPEVRNSIFSASARFGIEEHSPFTEPAILERNCLGGNALGDYLDEGSTVRGAAQVGTGNVPDLPAFVDLASGDLHVLASSPTIDRLAPASAPAIDVDGHARPQGASSDLGADEHVACAALADPTATVQAPPCQGLPTVLDATLSSVDPVCATGLRYEWKVGNVVVGTTPTLAVSPASTTTYRLRVTCADPHLSACFGEATVTVDPSFPPPTATAGPDQSLCVLPGAGVVLDLDGAASAVPPASLATLLWSATAGSVADPAQAKTTLALTAAPTTITSTATLAVADSNGCPASDAAVLAARPIPTADPGGPYAVLQSGGATTEIPLDGSGSSGEAPLAYLWTTDLGTFKDTGTAASALVAPVLVVVNDNTLQRANVCLAVTAANGCVSSEACTKASVLLEPALPPLDVGNTLRLTRAPPADVAIRFADAPVDAAHDEALIYELWRAGAKCGAYALALTVARVPGTNTASAPDLQPPPALYFYQVLSVNDGGTSLPRPADTICQ